MHVEFNLILASLQDNVISVIVSYHNLQGFQALPLFGFCRTENKSLEINFHSHNAFYLSLYVFSKFLREKNDGR